MTTTYPILYEHPHPIRGVALPIFIHNFSYHLATLDIYEDGCADCWDLLMLSELQARLDSGWICTEPPDGARLSLHDLGHAIAEDSRWFLPTAQVLDRVQAIFEGLNPGRSNLLDLAARRRQIAEEDGGSAEEVWIARMRSEGSIYRLSADGQMRRGSMVPVLVREDAETLLVPCRVYADGLAQIGGDELHPVSLIRDMLADGRLFTSAPDGTYITLPGLGRFRALETSWYIDPGERWREIENVLAMLSGEPDRIEVCHQAYLAYRAEPTTANRERLRSAYEAVPEHQRLYTQRSMDNKDHDIKHILYGPAPDMDDD